MAASLARGASVPNRPVLLWSALALVAVALALSATALVVLSAGGGASVAPLPPVGRGVVRAAALDDQVVVATVDNKLVAWRDGRAVGEKQLPYLANALATLPTGRVAVGLVTGQVQVLDRRLQEERSLKVPGRVTGLAARPDGGLAVTYGSGPAANDFRVEQYDAAGALLGGADVGYPTRGVATLGGAVVFANVRGEVGAVDGDGRALWRTLATQALSAVAAAPDADAAFVGDVRGGVSRVSADGSIVWYRVVTEYEIGALHALPGGAGVIAGATDGSVFALDGDGTPQLGQRLVDSPIQGLVPTGHGAVSAIAANGSRFELDTSGLDAASAGQRLRLVWYVGVGVLIAAALALAAAGFGRSRAAVATASRRVYRARLAYALIAPSTILVLLFTYYPALMALYISFTNFSLSAPIEFVGLRNFTLMQSDPFLLVGVKNMLLLLVTSVVKHLTVPLLVAELIFWIRSERVKYWLRTAFVLPAIVPGIVAILLWKMIWAPNIGLVNQILQTLGLGQYQRAWLGEESTALLAVILTGLPWVDIFAFLVYFGGLLAIGSEIFEAAAVDGAGWLRRFWTIDLPSLAPQIRLVLFFTFLGSIQGFAGIFVLTGGGPGTATYVPALEMYIMISRSAEFGYASAIGFALAALVGFMVFLRLRFDPQGQER
ncbi:MAG TPA: ABC transporter permease subunit [Chloroflexota bacterium]